MLRRPVWKLGKYSNLPTAIYENKKYRTLPLLNTRALKRLILRSTHFSKSSQSAAIMSSEDEYAAFLAKSQKDYSKPSSTTRQDGSTNANTHATSSFEHPAISKLGDRYYTSESDEPFTSIQFEWKRDELPTAGNHFSNHVVEGTYSVMGKQF